MSAGTAYTRRYASGFKDKPNKTTPIDQEFLNAVEEALLQLLGQAPSADAQVMQWDDANTRFGPALLLNKNIDPAAAIASSKIDFTGANALTNAAIAGAAAIARSKLDFGAGLVNADIAAAAAIAISKLAGYPGDASRVLKGDGSWGAPTAPGMVLIADAVYAAAPGTATVTFASIPQTYKHLHLKVCFRGVGSAGPAWHTMRFNGLSTGLYDSQFILGGGGTAMSSNEFAAQTGALFAFGYNQGGTSVVDVLHYTESTIARKQWQATFYSDWGGGVLGAAGRHVGTAGGIHRSAPAITQIDLIFNNNIAAGTRVSLYGVN